MCPFLTFSFGFGHYRGRRRRSKRGRQQGRRLRGNTNFEAAFEHAASGQSILGLQEKGVDETESALPGATVQLSGAARRDWTKLVEQGGT